MCCHPPERRTTALVDMLVQDCVLTPFQAERVLTERPESLTLGSFILVETVGRGSVGTTYKALRMIEGERFAVRVLPQRIIWQLFLTRQQLVSRLPFSLPTRR